MKRLVLLMLFMLSACGPSKAELQQQMDELQDENAGLIEKIDNIKEKSDRLKEASGELQDQLARFQYDNWRDVVPDTQQAGDEVASAEDDLQNAIDE